MRRGNDDVRAARREAAEFIAKYYSSWPDAGSVARRLRGLARRTMVSSFPPGRCAFLADGLCYAPPITAVPVCNGYDDPSSCPLSRGPIVVQRREP